MDLRIERTYQLLTQAFTHLLENMHYDDITVAALCEQAMIRRTTFYKHFADKDEFFVFYLKTIRDDFKKRIRSSEHNKKEKNEQFMLKETLDFLKNHECLTNNVINSPSSALLFDALAEVIFNDNLQLYKTQQAQKDTPQETIGLEIESAFLSGGIMQMMRYWWKQGCPPDGERYMLNALERLPR